MPDTSLPVAPPKAPSPEQNGQLSGEFLRQAARDVGTDLLRDLSPNGRMIASFGVIGLVCLMFYQLQANVLSQAREDRAMFREELGKLALQHQQTSQQILHMQDQAAQDRLAINEAQKTIMGTHEVMKTQCQEIKELIDGFKRDKRP